METFTATGPLAPFTLYHGTTRGVATLVGMEGFKGFSMEETIFQGYAQHNLDPAHLQPWAQEYIESDARKRLYETGKLSFTHCPVVASRWAGFGGEVFQELEVRIRRCLAVRDATTEDEFWDRLETSPSDYRRIDPGAVIAAEVLLDPWQQRVYQRSLRQGTGVYSDFRVAPDRVVRVIEVLDPVVTS